MSNKDDLEGPTSLGGQLELENQVNHIFKFSSIFWLVTSEKLAATPHHQSFKDSFHQAYDHDQLHMVVFCQFSCHHWHLFSVTRRSRNDVLVNGSVTLRTELTNVTLASEDTHWKLYWCNSGEWWQEMKRNEEKWKEMKRNEKKLKEIKRN